MRTLQTLAGFAPTCVHLVHIAEEVLWSCGDTVAPQPQATVSALLPWMIWPSGETQKREKLQGEPTEEISELKYSRHRNPNLV